MTLSRHQRLASRYLGLLIDEATQGRLNLHGFVPDGFGCVVRDDGAVYTHARALSICVDEAAEPVGVGGSGAEGNSEADQEVAADQDEAGEVHAPTISPAALTHELGAR